MRIGLGVAIGLAVLVRIIKIRADSTSVRVDTISSTVDQQ